MQVSYGLAPIFDFNHAFEALPEFACLPELLFGRKMTLLESARKAVSKLGIELKELPPTNSYAIFVNERIRLI